MRLSWAIRVVNENKLAIKDRGIGFLHGKSAIEYNAWRALGDPFESKFSKDKEFSSPGHYSVFLEKNSVQADMVATSGFSALHKYVFPTEASPRGHKRGIFLNVCHSAHSEAEIPLSKSECKSATLKMNSDGSFDASMIDGKNSYTTYLHGEVRTSSHSKLKWIACDNGADEKKLQCVEQGSVNSENGVLLAQLLVDSEVEEVHIDVGLSFVSAELAATNLHTSVEYQAPFSQAVEAVNNIWCDELSYLNLSADESTEKMLYSASYRTRLTPAVYSEYGGVYHGFDDEEHNINDERKQYSTNSTQPEGKFYSEAPPAPKASPPSSGRDMTPFKKMQKLNIPDQAIRNKMVQEGFSSSEIDNFFGDGPSLASGSPPVPSRGPPGPPSRSAPPPPKRPGPPPPK